MKNQLDKIYDSVKLLIKVLDEDQKYEDMKKLNEAIVYGNSFGEILSNLGVELSRMLQCKSLDKYKVNIKNILKLIDEFEV